MEHTLSTEQLVLLITTISGVIVAFGKHVVPIIMAWFGLKDKETKIIDQLRSNIIKLETNHLAHIQADIEEINKKIDIMSQEQIAQGKKVARLEAIIEK